MMSSLRKPEGYWYDKEGIARSCDKIDERSNEIKIGLIYYDYDGVHRYLSYQWIPKKDYHKYYTLAEGSEILINLRKYYKKNDIGVKEYVVLERELILLEKQNNRYKKKR